MMHLTLKIMEDTGYLKVRCSGAWGHPWGVGKRCGIWSSQKVDRETGNGIWSVKNVLQIKLNFL
jgi:hypothetical protein